jgi:hypothetical protein
MILETAQMLSTAVRLVKPEGLVAENIYKKSHVNHPCSIWARESKENFLWLCRFGEALQNEYYYRYGKTHKSYYTIRACERYIDCFPSSGLTPFAQAMPDKYKNEDAVKAYRDYYNGEKQHLFKWKNRDKPHWTIERKEDDII